MRQMTWSRRNDRKSTIGQCEGFSLIETLITTSLVAITAFVTNGITSNFERIQAALSQTEKIKQIRRDLSTGIDCYETLNSANLILTDGSVICPEGTELTPYRIALKNAGRQIFDLSNLGDGWKGRLSCGPTSLVIRIQRQNGTDVLTDPITKARLDWENTLINPLFGDSASTQSTTRSPYRLCSSYLAQGSRVGEILSLTNDCSGYDTGGCSELDAADVRCSLACKNHKSKYISGYSTGCIDTNRDKCTCFR